MVAPPAQLTDLVLTFSGGILSANVPIETEWAGIQKMSDPSTVVEGVHEANRYFDSAAGTKVTSCSPIGSGYYRAWSADFDYDIHFSNIVQVP